jgi:hypothetical protein
MASVEKITVAKTPDRSALQEAISRETGFDTIPDHYQLLGLESFQANLDVIERAIDRFMADMRTKQFTPGSKDLLTYLAQVRLTLLNNEKKAAYDANLREEAAAKTAPAVTAQTRAAITTVAPSVAIATKIQENRTTQKQGTLQKYGYAIAAGTALTVAGISALWATSSSGKGSDASPTAAKAALDPNKNDAPPTPVTPVAEQEEIIDQEEKVETVEEDVAVDETPELVGVAYQESYAPAQPAPAQETSFVANTVATEDIQVAQAPEAAPPAPRVAASKLPERRDLSGLANGNDAGFTRVDVPVAELSEAKQKLADAFPNADVATILKLLNSKNVIGSPARMKAVLEHAMERAKGTTAAEDDTTAFDAVLANAQYYTNTELEAHAATTLHAKASKGALVSARELLRKLAERPEIFSKEFLIARTRVLLVLAENKSGDPVLPVLAQDLVQLGAMTPREAMLAEARDLRKQSQDPNLRKPSGAEDARQTSIRMLNLARDGATIDQDAAQALVELAKKTVGKYARSKEFLDAVASVEAVIKTAKQAAEYTKILKNDPFNVRALQGRADLRLAQGDIEGALDDLDKSGNALAKQTRALRANPKGNECYKCSLEWLKLANMTMNGRKASMIVIAHELMLSATSATEDALDDFAVEAVKMKLGELAKLPKEHDVAHVKTAPAPNVMTAPDAVPQWKSVMADIDPKKHAVSGEWSKNERGQLTVKPAQNTRLVLPWKFPTTKDYDVKMEFDLERTEGDNSVQIILPVGKGATVVINGWPERGGITGITNINGADASRNESMTKGIVLPRGKHVLQVGVKKQDNSIGITAFLGGQQILSWNDDINSLTPHKDLMLEPGQIGLSAYNSGFIFSDVRFMDMTAKPAAHTRMHTVKPVIDAKNMEPTRPKNVPKEAQYSPETKSFILIFPIPTNIFEAAALAKEKGGKLFYPKDQAARDAVAKMLRGRRAFLGIVKKNGIWIDMEGNEIKYSDWKNGEPSGYPDEIYATMDSNGQFADISKSMAPQDNSHAVIEFPLR